MSVRRHKSKTSKRAALLRNAALDTLAVLAVGLVTSRVKGRDVSNKVMRAGLTAVRDRVRGNLSATIFTDGAVQDAVRDALGIPQRAE